MTESATVRQLRSRAEHCRRLACGALSMGIADELGRIADDYEHDAHDLEIGQGASPRAGGVDNERASLLRRLRHFLGQPGQFEGAGR